MAFGRGGPRSRATVRVLGLNRPPLVHERTEAIERVDRLLDSVENAGGFRDVVIALWLDIDEMVSAEAEYASACRSFSGVADGRTGSGKAVCETPRSLVR